MVKEEQKIARLVDGTVVDHLKSGTGYRLYGALGLQNNPGVCLLGQGLSSKRAEKKKI